MEWVGRREGAANRALIQTRGLWRYRAKQIRWREEGRAGRVLMRARASVGSGAVGRSRLGSGNGGIKEQISVFRVKNVHLLAPLLVFN
jgi:hypothetical protein